MAAFVSDAQLGLAVFLQPLHTWVASQSRASARVRAQRAITDASATQAQLARRSAAVRPRKLNPGRWIAKKRKKPAEQDTTYSGESVTWHSSGWPQYLFDELPKEAQPKDDRGAKTSYTVFVPFDKKRGEQVPLSVRVLPNGSIWAAKHLIEGKSIEGLRSFNFQKFGKASLA